MRELTHYLINEARVLRSGELIKAFDVVDRAEFVLAIMQHEAYADYPLPLMSGQTISQPSTVAFMLELLGVGPAMEVLDVGAGSGWQTAILASLVGESGNVYAIERIPELCEFGKKNVEKYGLVSSGVVEFVCGDGSLGLPHAAPFDRIIAAAAAHRIPDAWIEQLAPSGRVVCPIGPHGSQDIVVVEKDKRGALHEQRYRGFVFVPLVPGTL